MAEQVHPIADVTAMEADYVEQRHGSLLPDRTALVERWRFGPRDRETALRLAFLDWYSCSEPDFLTGMPELPSGASFFTECSDHLLASHYDDEVGFVFGWMMKSFPYCCGTLPYAHWLARGQQLWSEHSTPERRPEPAVFMGRGAYGHYFAHIFNVALRKRRCSGGFVSVIRGGGASVRS